MAVKSRQQILAKREAVYGTDPIPTGAADAVIAVDDVSLSILAEDAEVSVVDGYLDGLEHVAGTLAVEVSFSTMLKGSGAKGTPPDIAPLLMACGMLETVVGATSVTYTLAEVFNAGAGYQSCTLYVEDGVYEYQIHGCYGSWALDASIAGFPKLAFKFVGLYERPTAQAIDLPTFDTTRPVANRGLTFSVNAVSARCTSFSMDLARETHLVRSMDAAFGVVAVELGRCSPNGSWTIQEEDTVTGVLANFITPFETGTLNAWSWVWGATAGNITTLARPAGNTSGGLKWRSLSRSEDNGIITQEMGFTLGRHAGNDTLSLAFT